MSEEPSETWRLPPPPAPSTPMPAPPSPPRRGGWRVWSLAALVPAVAIIVTLSLAFGWVNPAWPSRTGTTVSPADPSATLPSELKTEPAEGFPDGWVKVSATDGSFTVTSPGPGTLRPVEGGFWALDVHQWLGASCAMYLYRTGEESHPLRHTRKRLLAWVAKMVDPHERLTQVRLGSSTGWRTELSFEEGEYPVGAFQVVYADGWEYSMGCGLSFTHPASDDRLTHRFLASFRAPVS